MKQALRNELVKIEEVDAPEGCQDAIYTANWGLSIGDFVIASRLPGPRKGEELYARKVFRDLGKQVIVPPWQRFSGQGDALILDDMLFLGHGYRSDDMESFFRRRDVRKAGFNYRLVNLQTKPLPSPDGRPVLNKLSGWPDSYYYDIDLAMTMLEPSIGDKAPLIGWCPEAFTPESQEKILKLWGRGVLRLIEVSEDEAKNGVACNAVSTGYAVIMGNKAPEFQAKIEAAGLRTVPLKMDETNKGGGGPRCVSNDISDKAA
jgi:N-dimethylarginine dimethylaminohydrolase